MADETNKDDADLSWMVRYNIRVETFTQGPEDLARLKAMYGTPLKPEKGEPAENP